MSRIWFCLAFILITVVGCDTSSSTAKKEQTEQAQSAEKVTVETVGVVAPDAEVKELANIDQYVGKRSKTEGPVADDKGNVYFSDPYGPKLYKWSTDGTLSIYSEAINGPNGLGFDLEGNLIACEAYKRRMAMLDKNGKATSLTDSYEGKKYNEPNDLFIDTKGGIYFSDPYFHVHTEPLEQEIHGLYYITPDRSQVIRVIDDMGDPNGICSTPDGTQMYVINTSEQKTYLYDVNPDGTLSGKRLFVPWGIDGLGVDIEGNVYITGAEDYVNVYNKQGMLIDKIVVPITKGHTANLCFGGEDMRTLFITAGNSLFSIRLRVKGF